DNGAYWRNELNY
ncbi:hypothetical protein J4045_08385, partial [Klebsiella aerogenes]